MKNFEELNNTNRLLICQVTVDGGNGEVHFINWTGSVIWSCGGGWEHVSVAPYNRRIIPSWEDMCRLKDMFFHENEAVVQIHPPKSEYVNMVQNCLHLWRPINQMLPLPNSLMVGFKSGQGMKELKEFTAQLEKEERKCEMSTYKNY